MSHIRSITTKVTLGCALALYDKKSWARALVPTALLAAVLAGIVLWRYGSMPPITVEELLVSEIQGETIPVMASPARTSQAVIFATERF